jgi:hypothetical protein
MSPITKASGTKRVVLTRCPFVGRLLHPPDAGGAAVGVRAARRLRDAGAGLEKRRMGSGRAARAGPGAHPLTPPARRRVDEDKGGGIMTTTIRGLEKRTFDAPDESASPLKRGGSTSSRSPASPSTGRRYSRGGDGQSTSSRWSAPRVDSATTSR